VCVCVCVCVCDVANPDCYKKNMALL